MKDTKLYLLHEEISEMELQTLIDALRIYVWNLEQPTHPCSQTIQNSVKSEIERCKNLLKKLRSYMGDKK